MYCPNCNQKFDSKFCPECGTKLVEELSQELMLEENSSEMMLEESSSEVLLEESSGSPAMLEGNVILSALKNKKEKEARQEAERKAKEEAERKALEKAERKAREEVERKAREEAERKAREDAERAKQKAEESRIVEDRKKIKKQSNSIPKIISVIVGIMSMIWTVLAFKDIDDFPWWAILLLGLIFASFVGVGSYLVMRGDEKLWKSILYRGVFVVTASAFIIFLISSGNFDVGKIVVGILTGFFCVTPVALFTKPSVFQ